MNQTFRMCCFASLLLAVACLTAIASRPRVGAALTRHIKVEVLVRDTIQNGDSLWIRVVAKNVDSVPVHLDLIGLPSSIGRTRSSLVDNPSVHDAIVLDARDSIVWRARRLGSKIRNREPAIIGAILDRVLGPGEQLEWTSVWDLQANAPGPVSPGEYKIVGILLLSRDSILSAPRPLVITP